MVQKHENEIWFKSWSGWSVWWYVTWSGQEMDLVVDLIALSKWWSDQEMDPVMDLISWSKWWSDQKIYQEIDQVP